jgi:hypothetical protein
MHVSEPNQATQKYAAEALEKHVVEPAAFVRRFFTLASPSATDLKLHKHQKDLFAAPPGLILLTAPTGQGKTVAPIALTNKYKIIYLCGVRHVGVALAKACIAAGNFIAIAFGCSAPSDVRLHHRAVTTFSHLDHSGRMVNIDNMDGRKVEVVIADLHSAPHVFDWWAGQPWSDASKTLLYWDEPTVGLDSKDHPFQPVIRGIWAAIKKHNLANVVFSSATLPKPELLDPFLAAYTRHFDLPITRIEPEAPEATVCLLDMDNFAAMPHHVVAPEERERCAAHLRATPALLRYVDLHGACAAVAAAPEEMWAHRFPTLADVTAANIKKVYVDLIPTLAPEAHRRKVYPSTVKFMTADAHTIDGPAIFMTDDIDTVARYCIQHIPVALAATLEANLKKNEETKRSADVLRKKLDDENAQENEKKVAANKLSPSAKKIKAELDLLEFLDVELPKRYQPNSADHLQVWAPTSTNAFTGDIDTATAQKILETEAPAAMKILLLSGIGGFFKEAPIEYTSIVKRLAAEKRLFMILADTDYIYGTNYPFYHAYVGKDLKHISQQKYIQALGRVARFKANQLFTVRFRDNAAFRKLFLPDEENIEAQLMNEIFC